MTREEFIERLAVACEGAAERERLYGSNKLTAGAVVLSAVLDETDGFRLREMTYTEAAVRLRSLR